MGKENVGWDIRVNCVTPAAIETAMLRNESAEKQQMSIGRIPLGRPGTAEEVASLICWLASEECSFSTGAIFDLSGGRSTY
jgi:3-oxoacyl-[acyl-carrier protein] reductase